MSGQEGFERVAQKRRTRNALLAAARELLADGRQPTVPEAADCAGISRATAYRYFSTPAVLAEEAVLDGIAVEFETLDLQGAQTGDDPVRRAEETVSAILGMVLRNERLFRTYLGLAVEHDGRRGARRVRWLREALAPAAIPPEALDRLVNGLSLLVGIETAVVLKDICGLDNAGADATARWVARTLVRGALSA